MILPGHLEKELEDPKSPSALTVPRGEAAQHDYLPDGRTGTWTGKR